VVCWPEGAIPRRARHPSPATIKQAYAARSSNVNAVPWPRASASGRGGKQDFVRAPPPGRALYAEYGGRLSGCPGKRGGAPKRTPPDRAPRRLEGSREVSIAVGSSTLTIGAAWASIDARSCADHASPAGSLRYRTADGRSADLLKQYSERRVRPSATPSRD